VESAQSRANLINQKHPELQAQVFSPDGHGGLYLVTLGGGMQRDDAVSLRQKALRLGMPRDSYIQNYKQ
jgi:eukaryotic-like serine/threonine-protein kinase